ncbi:unnamed protein product [Ranitomeya imitator]|uniref:MADF domain-containing protein n=1 Tax=Ranitomeya imitator TaxID=111125 RepID=A0ABN9M8C4_9NEOB|nr:unnamed protein product [Ranitomeya imitator]
MAKLRVAYEYSEAEDKSIRLGLFLIISGVVSLFILGFCWLNPALQDLQGTTANCTVLTVQQIGETFECTFTCGSECKGTSLYPCLQIYVNNSESNSRALLHEDEQQLISNPKFCIFPRKGGTSQIDDLTVCTALCQITDLTYSTACFTVPALSRLCEATSLPAGPGSAAILDPGLEQAGRERQKKKRIVVDEEPLTIHNETLINLVEANPSIWDQSDSSHHDIVKNRKLWDQIICHFDPRYMEKSTTSKKKIADAVHTRWKSIRDRFVRDYRNSQNAPSGSSGKRVTPYVHYDQLLFLQKTVSQRSTICSTAAPPRPAEELEPSSVEPTQPEDVSGISEPRSADRSTVAAGVSARLQSQRGRKRASQKDEADAIIVDGLQRVEDMCRSELKDLRREITELQARESVYSANEWKLLLLSYVPVVQNIPAHRNLMFRQRLNELVEEFVGTEEPAPSGRRRLDMPPYNPQYRGRGETSVEPQRQCSSPSYSWADNTPVQYQSL